MMHTVKSFFGMVDAETKRRVATFTDKPVEVSSNGVVEVKVRQGHREWVEHIPCFAIVVDGNHDFPWSLPLHKGIPDLNNSNEVTEAVNRYAEKITDVVRKMTKDQ